MQYSKTIAKIELDKYIDSLASKITNDFSMNNFKNFDCIEDYLDEKLFEFSKNGVIDNLLDKQFNHCNECKYAGCLTCGKDSMVGGCSNCMIAGCINCENKENEEKEDPYACNGNYCFKIASEKEKNKIAQCKLGKICITNEHENCLKRRVVSSDFEIFPNSSIERESIYISAPSRSGKTTFAKNYCMKYKKLFPNNEIFLFSRKTKDESIDSINPTRINIEEFKYGKNEDEDEDRLKEMKNKFDYKLFKNSIVIFDDLENISQDKRIMSNIKKLHDDILNLGGDQKISVITITHNVMCGNKTKNSIAESNKIVIFPNSGYQYIEFLKRYIGLDNKMAKKLMKEINSRWMVISRECPLYIMTENEIRMIK